MSGRGWQIDRSLRRGRRNRRGPRFSVQNGHQRRLLHGFSPSSILFSPSCALALCHVCVSARVALVRRSTSHPGRQDDALLAEGRPVHENRATRHRCWWRAEAGGLTGSSFACSSKRRNGSRCIRSVSS
ncbi:hypothetical protein VTN02DRAFT_1797 [Thermoascus thermophilus]